MKDKAKNQRELTAEIKLLKQRIRQLENSESERDAIEEELKKAKEELEIHAWGLKKTNAGVKILYKELENALKIRSNFTSTVSHELRTPLAAIKDSISIVLDGIAGSINNDQKEFLDIAQKNVDRLVRIINDVLDFQKLDSGKMAVRLEENNINDAVKEVYNTMGSLAKDKGLDFILKLEAGLPQVKFDKDKIVQVLINLVNNAVKFTEKGSITISTAQRDDFVRVSVQDSGPGIKAEDFPRLFQQFGQIEVKLSSKKGGTGLGLVISKEIIGLHRGRIWVDSEFGKGATFHFVLPVQERRG